ncbi:DUF2564 family protein [Bacillus sp. FJAT-45037]|uniref:DUF2564 family protein n=1 Tax=Bacillus sp. FJAT-45037 TaxID=2011007 RepID=UPI000C24188C|nr:DNA replication terminus site-binding protein [Bacillus sp. FJAT-45037]
MSEEYNELQQVEMAIKSAQRMVGQATVNMDAEQLEAATEAVNQAKDQYKKAVTHQTGVDQQFFEFSEELLAKVDQQLKEAKK